MLLPPAPPSARSQGGGLSPSPPRLPHGSLLHARTRLLHARAHTKRQRRVARVCMCVCVCVCVCMCVCMCTRSNRGESGGGWMPTSAKGLLALGGTTRGTVSYCTRSESAREARGVGQRGNRGREADYGDTAWDETGRRVWGVGESGGFLPRGFLLNLSTSRALRGPREAKPVRGVHARVVEDRTVLEPTEGGMMRGRGRDVAQEGVAHLNRGV